MSTRTTPDGDSAVNRRGLIGRLAAAAVAGFAAFKVTESAAETGPADGVPKVAYGVSDANKVSFALGNIANHIKGMGGPDKVHIVLVVNGPALSEFRADAATGTELAEKLAGVAATGVELGACGNTLDGGEMTVADLLPGFVRVDEGGVTRLAKLQAEGYAYIRP